MGATEKEKMLSGQLYRASDPELKQAHASAQRRMRRLNAIANEDAVARYDRLRDLLGKIGEDTVFMSPFWCDYGVNIRIGRNGFVNYNCIFLDCALITIGDDAQIAPCVQIYTAHHPLDAATRRSGLEMATPVTIGNNVWLGGGTIICPGVTIGDNTVIGAGSVVTRSIPAGVIAVGNPCRVLRPASLK
ncbi:MAG TPA: sugar O-acetyltransferase [Clostridia bacterium]|nr:sugar O-acetyltransferase [Clostridia bacterium]